MPATVLKDRVKVSSTTTGTGPLTASGTFTGFRGLSVFSDGDQVPYVALAVNGSGSPTGQWETGIGTVGGSGTTLARDVAVYANSLGTTALVNFSSGTKHVFVDRIADWQPFDQDLNTTDVVQLAGVGIGTPGAADELRFGANGGTISTEVGSSGALSFYSDGNFAVDVRATNPYSVFALFVPANGNTVISFTEDDGLTVRELLFDAGTGTLGWSGGFNVTGTVSASGYIATAGPLQFIDADGATIDGSSVAGALSIYGKDGMGGVVGTFEIQTTGLIEFANAGGVRDFNVDGSSTFPGSVSASSYTATALPSSDSGLSAGQFYHTAGVVMVKL